jgi:hypothetical protein
MIRTSHFHFQRRGEWSDLYEAQGHIYDPYTIFVWPDRPNLGPNEKLDPEEKAELERWSQELRDEAVVKVKEWMMENLGEEGEEGYPRFTNIKITEQMELFDAQPFVQPKPVKEPLSTWTTRPFQSAEVDHPTSKDSPMFKFIADRTNKIIYYWYSTDYDDAPFHGDVRGELDEAELLPYGTPAYHGYWYADEPEPEFYVTPSKADYKDIV